MGYYVFLTIAVFVLAIIANRMLDHEYELTIAEGIIKALEAAGVTAICCFLLSRANLGSPWAAPVCLVVVIALMFAVVYYWKQDGSEWNEMIPFAAILAVLFFAVARPAAKICVDSLGGSSPFWTTMVGAIPLVALVATVGIILHDYFSFHEMVEVDDNTAVAHGDLARLVAIITGIIIALLLIAWPIVAYAMDKGEAEATAETTKSEVASSEASEDSGVISVSEWRHFYNADLQADEDTLNDFNFGPKPNCTTPEEYDADFRARLKKDPALAAADTAWLDANVGTRYLGEFYESCQGDWAKTINEAKDRFSIDQEAFYKDLDAFFAFLDSAVKVEVRQGTDLDDQMYMNPHTASGVPDVIVMETDDHEGTFLVYTFVIKGTAADVAAAQSGKATPANNGRVFEVAYRVDCGYQPTNVEKIMNITPQENPNKQPTKKTTPTPTNPTVKPDDKGDTPQPKPQPKPTPSYNKDPDKAPKKNTEPNDDKGPGPNTNNGVGATESKSEQPTNTKSYESYDQYKQDVQDLKETNQTQKTGSDSNKPSTPAPKPSTNVDNNADKGTNNGGINTPTPVKPPATEASTGQQINTTPGEAWGGPAD